MKKQKLSTVLLYLVLCIALVAFIGGCQGSNGIPGAQGAPGHDASFTNSTCVNCHHMSDSSSSAIEPFKLSLVTVGTNTIGFPITATVKTVFSNGTGTVNATGYFWEYMGGLASTKSSIATGPIFTVTVTAGQDYKAALVANEMLPDRIMIVPVNGLASEFAQNSEYIVTVYGDDGKIYYDYAKFKASDNNVSTYAPVLTPGINNVPINMPVLLNAKTAGGYNWSFTSTPGTAPTINAATTKNPYFTPVDPGQYVITDGNSNSLTIYAGTWRGAITGVDMNTLTADGNGTPVSDTACTGCHDGSTAPDKFTPWKSTGHATRFEEGLNGGGYRSTCFSCHTVGFVSTAKGNNGFRDQANYSAFAADTSYIGASGANTSRYSNMASSATYSALFKETGIQCENCHGPQTSSGHEGVAGSPRTSLASDVCGQCHGSPQHHGRFQEWQESPTGHASFELAIGEAIDSTNPQNASANCAGCHSAQGNLKFIKQLAAGNPLRSLPAFSLNADTVQPQTCVVCHDPHAVGSTTGEATDAQPRVTGSTPKLPAGFAALGVGKGAQCMICHNTRNGGIGSTKSDGTIKVDSKLGVGGSYLHEDNDPIFGSMVSNPSNTSYAAPHAPAQGDVLMGHNAYFMGSSGGNNSTFRSPHSQGTVVDTCVTCHMVKTKPPQIYSDFENTNHTFKASLEICSDCHGIDVGLGPKLQMDTEAMLEQLATDINNAFISQATGTYSGNIASVNIYISHGSPVVDVTYKDSTPADTGINPRIIVPLDTENHRTLAKAIWNYNLILNDNSLGVHNPNFIRDVLGATDAKVRELL